jgi:hypothetical protein
MTLKPTDTNGVLKEHNATKTDNGSHLTHTPLISSTFKAQNLYAVTYTNNNHSLKIMPDL